MLFSVLIPNYGFSDSTIRCFNSIKRQIQSGFYDFELLVCDQSDDESKNKIKTIVSEFEGVSTKVIDLKDPNVLEARKTLLRHSSGEYIFFMDSDDFIDDGFFELVMKTIIENKHPDLLITSFITEQGKNSKKNTDLGYINSINFVDYFYCSDLINTLWRKVFKRKLFDEKMISELDSTNGDDWIISLPVISNADSIVFAPYVFGYHYCINKNGLTNTMSYDRFIKSFALKDNFIVEKNIKSDELLFNSRMVKFIGFSCSCKDKKTMKDAFKFVRYNLLIKLGIKFKSAKGLKNKLLYFILKMKQFPLFFLLIKILSRKNRLTK